jgi:hypothetical protein
VATPHSGEEAAEVSGDPNNLHASADRANVIGSRRFGVPPDTGRARVDLWVHAIVVDDDRILVLDDGRYFALPGGSAGANEDPVATLAGYLRGQTGHDLAGALPFQRAHQRATEPTTGTAVDKDCRFYLVDLGHRSGAALARDRAARWAPREAALDLMAEDASRWALSVALCAQAIVSGLSA